MALDSPEELSIPSGHYQVKAFDAQHICSSSSPSTSPHLRLASDLCVHTRTGTFLGYWDTSVCGVLPWTSIFGITAFPRVGKTTACQQRLGVNDLPSQGLRCCNHKTGPKSSFFILTTRLAHCPLISRVKENVYLSSTCLGIGAHRCVPTSQSRTQLKQILFQRQPALPCQMESETVRHSAASVLSEDTMISVATSQETAIIRCIENGEYVEEGATDDDTRSLTDSIRQHIVDGGLRYHAYHAGQYAFPNDETEQYRDDLKHHLTLHLCEGSYFHAPITHLLENAGYVLDLGTGTGRWCVELADLYPNAIFEGMDLSPIQPDWVPENVSFVVDDVEHESGWTYPPNKFDYVHVRHLIHSIKDRGQMWKRIYSHLKPGGYVEIQEFMYVAACDDHSCDGPYAVRDFLNYLAAGLQALGSDLNSIRHIEGELVDSGFTELHYQDLKCPIGPWAKKLRLQECGHILRDVIMWGLEGLSRRPFRDGLHWTPTQIQMFLVDVRKDLSREENRVPPFHSYFPFRSIYGRKPLDAL